MSQSSLSRRTNQSIARSARKRRQRRSAAHKQVRLSVSVKSARRVAAVAKAVRHNERRAAVLAQAIATTKKVVVNAVRRNERLVARPVLRQYKPVVSAAVAARRAAAQGSASFAAEVAAGVQRAMSHNVVDYMERAQAMRLRAEALVADAIGVQPQQLTKAVVAQLVKDGVEVVAYLPVEEVRAMKLPALKQHAVALGLTYTVGSRTVLHGCEDQNHARKETWLNAVLSHYAQQDNHKGDSVMNVSMVEEEAVGVVVEGAQEELSVLQAVSVNDPISEDAIKKARRDAFGAIVNPLWLAAEEGRKPYIAPMAIQNAYWTNKSGVRGTHSALPLNNSILDAVAVTRYGKGLVLPQGFEVGMNLVVPPIFTERWEKTGQDENGKAIWTSVPVSVIPGIDLLLALSKQPGQKPVEKLWQENKQRKEDGDKLFLTLKKMGYIPAECAVYAKAVSQTLFYLESTKSAFVMVPAEVAKVVLEVIKSYRKGLLSSIARILPIRTNWLMPAVGADYKRALGAFKVIEQGIQAYGFGSFVTERPLTLIEGQGQFVVWFGEHMSLLFEKNGNVTVRDHSVGSESVVQPVLVCAHRYYGEFASDEVVKLNAIDQVLYHMENYHAVDFNRAYPMDSYRQVLPSASKMCSFVHASTVKYIKEAYVTERINPDWTPGHAMPRFRRTAKPVVLAAPGLFVKAENGQEFYNKDTAVVAFTLGGGDINETLNTRRELTSLNPSMAGARAVEPDGRALIAAGYDNGVTIRPFGNCRGFAGNELYADKANVLPLEHRKVFVLESCRNAWNAKAIKSFGFFSEEGVENFLRSLFGALPSADLWAKACDELVFPGSDKVAKAIARVDKMMMPVDMQLEGMEYARFRQVGDREYRQVKVVEAGLMLQHPVEPGMGFLQENSLLAEYITSGREQGFFNPGENPLELSARLAEKAEVVATTSGIHKYAFTDVTVELSECLGWFVDCDGVRTPINAEQSGQLKEIRFGTKRELSGAVFFVTLRYARKTYTHKLRLNVKLNAAHAAVDKMLSRNEEKLAATLLVMQDCNKWFDLKQGGIFTIIAETFSRHEKFRPLLLKANKALNPSSTEDQVLLYDRHLRLRGKYNFLMDAFLEEFGRATWWTSPCTEDFARLFFTMYGGMAEAGKDGWRDGEANEFLDGNIPENASVYTNAPVSDEVVVDYDVQVVDGVKTKVRNVRAAVCTWQDNDGIWYIAIRGFALIGTPECPLYAPVLSEYTAVEQAVGQTDVLAFDMIDLALRGKGDLAQALMAGGDQAREDHVAFMTLLNNGAFVDSEEVELPVVVVDQNTAFFSASDKEELQAVENDAIAWFKKVIELKADTVYLLEGRTFFLPVLARMGVHNVLSGQDTVVSKTYSFLRMLYNGYSPLDENVLREYKRIFRMLATYVEGESHRKALVRGAKAVTCKVAGLPIIPTGQAAMVGGGRVYQEMSGLYGKGVRHIMMWRPPIRNAAVLALNYVYEGMPICNEFSKLYALGWYKLTGDRLYVGRDQNFNFGDYDGDPVKFINVTKSVLSGALEVDNHDSMMAFLESVIGVDMTSAEFWSQKEPVQQYFADHFFIPSYSKVMKKMALGLDAFKSKAQWVDFLKAATEVQKVSVGHMYRMSAMHEMLAEVMNSADLWAVDRQWVKEFGYLKGQDARKYTGRVETLYETTLGGYSKDMEALMVGYLSRAINADKSTDWSTLKNVKSSISSGSNSSILDGCGLIEFTHVPLEEVSESMESLGFCKDDLGFMTKAAIFTAMGKKIGTLKTADDGEELLTLGIEEDLTGSEPTLLALLCVNQVVLNYSQAKRYDQSARAIQLLDSFCKYSDPVLSGVVKQTLERSLTGQLFARLQEMEEAVVANTFQIS